MKFCGKDPCECEPVAPMTFVKEREHAAELFSNCRNGKFSSANCTEWARSLEGFNQGANWAREQTIKEVLSLLRGESEGQSVVADWLESELNKNTQPDEVSVKLKDPSFVLPEYY